MSISVVPYASEHKAAALDFNTRMRSWGFGSEYDLPASARSSWLPNIPAAGAYNDIFLALEDGTVRGAYFLKHEQMWFRGEGHWVGSFHHMVSEGIVNERYATVGAQLLRHCLRIRPLCYCLGLGGSSARLPTMLLRMGWSCSEVPFHFRIVDADKVLKQSPLFRSTALRRVGTRILSSTGVAPWIVKALQNSPGRRLPTRGLKYDVVREFGSWSDKVWRECANRYSMAFMRDRETLRALYSSENANIVPLIVARDGATLGWAVVGDLQTPGNHHYGNLRVGALLDGLAKPEDAAAVVQCAVHHLEQRGVELIVSNQRHPAWISAVKNAGFLKGPSRCIFAASKQLTALLSPFQQTLDSAHLNRSASDGLHIYTLAGSCSRHETESLIFSSSSREAYAR